MSQSDSPISTEPGDVESLPTKDSAVQPPQLAPEIPVNRRVDFDTTVEAMALTAIVIGLAVTALLLVLVLRVVHAYESREIDEVAEEEADRDAQLERLDAREHEDEEAAAR